MAFKSAFTHSNSLDISHCNILNLQLHEPQWSTKVVQFARNLNYLYIEALGTWIPDGSQLVYFSCCSGFWTDKNLPTNARMCSRKGVFHFEILQLDALPNLDTDRYAELKVVSIQNWSPPSLSFYLYITRQIAASVQSRCLLAPWRISLFNQGPLSHNLT